MVSKLNAKIVIYYDIYNICMCANVMQIQIVVFIISIVISYEYY